MSERMTTERASATIVRAAIDSVAPDLDVPSIPATARLQQDLGLDSLDFLNVVAAVHRATGIDVPEADYPQIATIASFAEYLDRGASDAG